MENKQMNRQLLISQIENSPDKVWDVIIIGGGATGLGTALDSVSRGFSTLLLEQSDFAKATSSRSTKLVHGGVRYMAQGDLLLVMEACRERGILLKNAPHLTMNQEFVIPVYTAFDALKYTIGLKFYDLLAGSLSMGKSYYIDRDEILQRLPNIKKQGLRGGIVYHDGQFDDSRLAITLAETAVEKGGYILNYFGVKGLIKNHEGKTSGVKATDIVTGKDYMFHSKVVINATGVFADGIARMDDENSKPSIRPSQGVHLVVDRSFLAGNSAIMIPKTADGRVLFAIPWYDKVVIGTTDTPLENISLEPVALETEINFILETARDYLVKFPERSDILCVFAGLRPLAADPDNKESTKEVSRRHKITVSPSDLISVVGGKWTTYRVMAEETIDKAIRIGLLEGRKPVTRNLRMGEAPGSSGRLNIYGKGANEILRMIDDNPALGKQVHENFSYTIAEIIWICHNEMPVNVEDIIARRTRALLLDARSSREMAPYVARIMARELGYNEEWQKNQVESYNRLTNNYI
jgi:glycerol-3-phosphate dehydrogenase